MPTVYKRAIEGEPAKSGWELVMNSDELMAHLEKGDIDTHDYFVFGENDSNMVKKGDKEWNHRYEEKDVNYQGQKVYLQGPHEHYVDGRAVKDKDLQVDESEPIRGYPVAASGITGKHEYTIQKGDGKEIAGMGPKAEVKEERKHELDRSR